MSPVSWATAVSWLRTIALFSVPGTRQAKNTINAPINGLSPTPFHMENVRGGGGIPAKGGGFLGFAGTRRVFLDMIAKLPQYRMVYQFSSSALRWTQAVCVMVFWLTESQYAVH